jgi:hypothetical protein
MSQGEEAGTEPYEDTPSYSAVPLAKPTNPIFIVGCPRSGTTLMRRIIAAHSRICCGPETHFLGQFIVAEDNNWMRLARFGITQDEWRAHMRDVFLWVQEQYAARQGKPRWAEKSPGYALHLDYIDSLFPDCQVIHMIRDPRDVLDSWIRRWGYTSGRDAIRSWPSHVKAARAFGAKHGPERYREVRYEVLVHEPEPVMRGLIEWLGESWEEEVLKLERKEHKRPPRTREDERRMWLGDTTKPSQNLTLGSRLESTVGDRGVGTSGIVTSSVGAHTKASNIPYLAAMYATSGRLMRELGYL